MGGRSTAVLAVELLSGASTLKPNHVTIVNSLLGFLSAWLFHAALPARLDWRRTVFTGYHSRRRRRRGTRLKMQETDLGQRSI